MNPQIDFPGGAIRKRTAFPERVRYDVGNNRITAQFDGVGGVSKYAVMNKFSVFSSYFALFSVDGKAFDWSGEKTVTMSGRTQETEFCVGGVRVLLAQFLDSDTNAVFHELRLFADRTCDFAVTINFGTDFSSYVQQLLANRLTAKNITKILGGFLKNKKKILTETDGISVARGEVFGDFYIDLATDGALEGLEAERKYFNQLRISKKLSAGENVLRYVVSAGTRTDYTGADVLNCMRNFCKSQQEAQKYCEYLLSVAPPAADTDFLKAYFTSCLNCALSNFKTLGDFRGFIAGIVYQFPARTYYRDGYWTALAALPFKPELVRDEIITLAKGVGKNGECPSAVKFNYKNHWGNHFDSPSFFVLMVHDYIARTGDKSVLKESVSNGTVLTIAQKVFDKLSEKADKTSLLVKDGDYNRRDWCDNVFRGGYVTYDEALYCRAAFCLGKLFELSGEKVLSQKYSALSEQIKSAINELLWDDKNGWYVNYRDGGFTEDNLSVDTVVCALFGISDKERTLRLLKNMESLLESKNNALQSAGDFGVLSVYPFYKDAAATVQKSSLPYYYHNGGDWPYLSNMYAYAKYVNGMDGTYPLTRWFAYNLDKGNFTPVEFFSPFHPDGSLLQAWSATGAFSITMLGEDFFGRNVSAVVGDEKKL